jgi:hypothetical protein
LPEARHGQWGEGLTAAEMEKCRSLKPQLIATIDYLERIAANHLRHSRFAGLAEDYQVQLENLSILELTLKPDLTPNRALATLAQCRVA